jgi:hypothetical protein
MGTWPASPRWRRSTITYGPAGRVIATLVVLFPIAFAVFVSVYFLVAAVVWLFLLPTALRDIWRPILVGEVEKSVPVGHLAAEADFVPVIAERAGPKRW